MPHLTIEYSANLDATGDLPGLCLALHQAMAASGLFEIGGVRVRTLPCPHYAIADLAHENAFAALTLRIGAGRSDDDKRRLGDALMAVAKTHFAAHLAKPHFALTLDLQENHPSLGWKANSIHPRLRAGG